MKKSIIAIVSIVVFIALAVVGGFIVNGSTEKVPQANTSDTSENTGSNSDSGNNTGNGPDSEDDKPSDIPDTDEVISAEEAKQSPAPTSLEDVKVDKEEIEEVSNFSKEDVQKILNVAYMYSHNAVSNKYFLSGQWAEDGYPIDMVAATNAPLMTVELNDKIKEIESDPNKNKQLAEDILPLVMFLSEWEGYSPHPACEPAPIGGENDKKQEPVSMMCPHGGLQYSDMEYTPRNVEIDGEITHVMTVEFTVEGDIPALMNGQDAITSIEYDYALDIILNPNYNADPNSHEFVVAAYDVQVDIAPVEIR